MSHAAPQDDLNVAEDDPRRPWKAWAATAVAAVGAFVAYWVADEDPFTLQDALSGVLSALVASGLTGGATFGVRNPKLPN